MPLEIIPFRTGLAKNFKDLNVAWLQRHFHVEPKDVALLENCEESIIVKGGFVFFAQLDQEIVGCFSFIKKEEGIYELGKMAVDEKYQGLKIGQGLLSFGVAYAKERHWKRIVLYSNTKLNTAIHIYKKYGFREVDLEKDVPYLRSDIKMELILYDQRPIGFA